MKVKIFGVLSLVIIVIGITVFATAEDPAVSLSYLTEIFLPKVEKQISDSSVFQVVELSAGEKFVGGVGCEVILRSGKATAIISANGGLTDVTGGTDLKEKEEIPQNHLLIIPRDDGRGFVSATKSFIMVKGNYTITK